MPLRMSGSTTNFCVAHLMDRTPVLNCRIEHWCGWLPGGLSAHSGTASVSRRVAGVRLEEEVPDVAFLPAMQRRRLSPLARAAFAAAWPCLRDGDQVPLVCSSAHGEMRRSVELLRSLAEAEPLSPMSFSLSVHNAIAGQLSIALADRAAVLALAPGEEGLAAAMVEACGLLLEGAEQVVVVWYDEPLPPPYQAFGLHEPKQPAALALRLGRGAAGTPLVLQRRPARRQGEQPAELAQLLGWLSGQGEAEFSSAGNCASWRWSLAA